MRTIIWKWHRGIYRDHYILGSFTFLSPTQSIYLLRFKLLTRRKLNANLGTYESNFSGLFNIRLYFMLNFSLAQKSFVYYTVTILKLFFFKKSIHWLLHIFSCSSFSWILFYIKITRKVCWIFRFPGLPSSVNLDHPQNTHLCQASLVIMLCASLELRGY